MTPTQLKEAAQVMLAASEGKQVQYRREHEWEDMSDPSWDWHMWTYRIKPEAREWWIVQHLGGSRACERCGPFDSSKQAEAAHQGGQVIKVREVIE